MANKSQKSNSTRIFIQVSLSKEEKEKIKKIATEKHTNASNLFREAIFDYIRRLEHPEMFNQTVNTQINPILLEQITKNTKKMIELQKITLERTNVLNEMNKTLDLVKRFSTEKGLENEKEVIINLFKAHNTLSKQEIIDKTGFDKTVILSIVSHLNENKIIKLTSRGRFEYNE